MVEVGFAQNSMPRVNWKDHTKSGHLIWWPSDLVATSI